MFNCTLPWIESMKGNLKFNSSETFTCNNTDDFWKADTFGFIFAEQIAKYKHTKCQGNLENYYYPIFVNNEIFNLRIMKS